MEEKRRFHHTPALDDMALFVAVVRHGSFHAASDALAMPGATLSRRIAAMEKRLGVRLLARTTRRVVGVRLLARTTRRVALNEAARAFYERCAVLVDEAAQAETLLRASPSASAVRLRLAMTADIARHWVAPLLPTFCRLYPQLSLDIDLAVRDDSPPPDLTLRHGSLRHAERALWPLLSLPQGLFAAPAYLARQAAPRTPADLLKHDGLGPTPRWRLQGPAGGSDGVTRHSVIVSDLDIQRELAEQGAGIAMLPHSLVQDSVRHGRLVPVLGDWRCPPLALLALAGTTPPAPLVSELASFLQQRLALG